MLSPLQQKAMRAPRSIGLTSPAFQNGKPIPREFSGYGEDAQPPLAWTGILRETRALALVVDDPDAPGGTWTHWTLWGIPREATGLARDADVRAMHGVEGRTSDGSAGWHGPKPPSGTHRYYFRVFALDRELDLPSLAPVDDVWRALGEHAIAWGELMGTFAKPQT